MATGLHCLFAKRPLTKGLASLSFSHLPYLWHHSKGGGLSGSVKLD